MYTFGPLIAKNSRSGRLLGGAPVTVTTLDGVTLTTTPTPLVTNHEGYLPTFTADTDQRVILARPRGGDPLPLYAHEAIGDAAEVAELAATGRLSEDALKSTFDRWGRGNLQAGDSANDLRLEQHAGVYRVQSSAIAESVTGLPAPVAGVLTVQWVRGSSLTSSVAIQTYTTDAFGGASSYRRDSSSAGWTPWVDTIPPQSAHLDRELASSADIDSMRLAAHAGPWRVSAASNLAPGTAAQLPVPRGGILRVEWVRGVNASTSITVQRYHDDLQQAWSRRSSSVGWTPWTSAGGGAVIDAEVTRVSVVLALGQSNMSGRGTPYGTTYGDLPDGRIWEYGSKQRNLRVASVPLDMHDTNAAAGLSPATTFARTAVRAAPPGNVVLLIPAAHGGTGFNTPGTWNWSDASGEWSLLAAALTQTAEAVTAAQTRWPSATVNVEAVLWHQGENTAGQDQAQHAAELDQLIDRVRAAYPGVPFILGELSPDRSGGVAGTPSGAAHQETPARVPGTALAHTPANGSRDGDLSHLGREAVEVLGERMCQAWPVAVANQPGVLQMPPPRVWAWRDGDVVRVEWDAPLCRALGYTVEATTDNGSTWSTSGVTVTGRRAEIASSSVTHVRVATQGTSATSRPAAVPVGGF